MSSESDVTLELYFIWYMYNFIAYIIESIKPRKLFFIEVKQLLVLNQSFSHILVLLIKLNASSSMILLNCIV